MTKETPSDFIRCWSGNQSYPSALWCDGIKHCPQAEDEQFCDGEIF